jgi:Xaa-Pro aminopeptidase
MNKQIIQARIDTLRKTLVAQDLTAIIVPSADPHLSEYLPEYWQTRQWLSGFTGSVGTLVVTADFAGLWTDSRYWVHAAEQLEGTGITLEKLAPGQRHVPNNDYPSIDRQNQPSQPKCLLNL